MVPLFEEGAACYYDISEGNETQEGQCWEATFYGNDVAALGAECRFGQPPPTHVMRLSVVVDGFRALVELVLEIPGPCDDCAYENVDDAGLAEFLMILFGCKC